MAKAVDRHLHFDDAVAGVVDDAPGAVLADIGAVIAVGGLRILLSEGIHDISAPGRFRIESAIQLRHDIVQSAAEGHGLKRLSGRKRRSRSSDRGWRSIDLAARGRESYPQGGKVDAHRPARNGPDHLKLTETNRLVPEYERLLASVVRTVGVERLALVVTLPIALMRAM